MGQATAVPCEVTTVLFISHLLNSVIKKQVAGTRPKQTLAEEAKIKLKMYEGLNDDDPSVMQINSVLQSDVMTIQEQGTQPENQGQTAATLRIDWKANFTCYKCGQK